MENWKSGALGRSAPGLRSIVPCVLLLCAASLALPGIAAAQAFPGPIPAWYSVSAPQQVPFYCLGGIPNQCGAGTEVLVLAGTPSLKIVWKNAYLYRAPGDEALYWYAQMMYQNTGTSALSLKCAGPVLVDAGATIPQDSQHIREVMSGTPNSSSVDADETLCKMDPDFRRIIQPGEVHYDWAIFHNVPWNRAVQGAQNSLVSLTWGPYGSTQAIYPWASPVSGVPAPAECPSELVSLKTCFANQPSGKMPNGQAAQNLIVLVHGCCTDEKGIWEIYSLADQIVGEILENNPASTSEVVVRDWINCLPTDKNYTCTPNYVKPSLFDLAVSLLPSLTGQPAAQVYSTLTTLGYIGQLIANINTAADIAYCAAASDTAADAAYCAAAGYKNGELGAGVRLAQDINCPSCRYTYIHLIGHSAGAKLIDEAARNIANKGDKFIQLTFLDAYMPLGSTGNNYGSGLESFSGHYVEHYVDKSNLPFTDFNVQNAFNFDITGWQPVNWNPLCDLGADCLDEKKDVGHQWPHWWYEKSVTSHWFQKAAGFRYGYPLSREGGNVYLTSSAVKTPSVTYPSIGQCIKLNGVGQSSAC